MVDIHSHVLPGLDDGAQTLEQSVAMLKMAEAAGTTDIVATPHANSTFRFDRARIDDVLAQVRAAYTGSVQIHLGCDFHLSYENVQAALTDPSQFTINRGPYLLVEFADIVMPNSGDILRRLVEVGLRPVITHPERNGMLQERLDWLERWITEGSYLQVTAHSFLGLFGSRAKRSSWTMAQKGLVHFVASDAHDVERRTPRLDEAYTAVKDRLGEKEARRIFIVNPAAAVSGAPLDAAVGSSRPKRKWFGLFG